MEYKFKNLQGKYYAIHCPTEKIFKEVLDIIRKIDKTCVKYYKSSSDWKDYKSEFCLLTYSSTALTYGDRDYCRNNNHIIILAEDFIAHNTETATYPIFN